ncbi:MAG: sialidase family protein [Verrucomicrobiota bacterium]
MRIPISCLFLWFFVQIALAEMPVSNALFPAEGESGLPYKRWRIPCLITAPDNTLLAICEGRVDGGGATGNIDLILKRSSDNGRTWGKDELIVDMEEDTVLNFCPVIDQTTQTIWLVFARNVGAETEGEIASGKGTPARIYMTHSTDSGRSWSEPEELTETLTKEGWTWGGGAPGVGLQLQTGRLLVPAYHAVKPEEGGNPVYESHMIYSDDHGATWQLGETVTPHTNECLIAERGDGSIYYNSRSQNFDKTRPFPAQFRGWRTIAESSDGGETWENVRTENALFDDPCQGSLHVLPREKDETPIWVFTHPSGPGRQNLVARVSFDEGKTWPGFRRIANGSAQYSSVTTMPTGNLGCLFEIWDLERRTNVIRFTEFSVDWLLDDSTAQQLPKVELGEVRKVEGAGEDHNAFTDLIRFRGQIYLAFRKSEIGHGVYPDSEIIIKRSEDEGKTWNDVYRFSVPDRDVRDPHFLIFKNQLFIYSGTWDARPLIKNKFELNDHIGVAVATKNGKTWTEPRMLEGTHGHYIWRAVSDGDQAYLCARRVKNFVRTETRKQRAHLTEQAFLVSDDGWTWKFRGLVQPDYGNETAYLIEKDGSLLGIARNGGGPAQIVQSKPPYTEFNLMNLDRPLGGPLLSKWNDHYLVGGRNTLYGKRVCGLYWLADDRLFPILELPSGGDCSYPGFVQLDDRRGLVSYYSSHEGFPTKPGREPPSSIFVAELEMND